MASLRRIPGSRFWIACFTLPDGTRTQRSTKTLDRRTAQRIADEWEYAAQRAREGKLVQAQARDVLNQILEKAGFETIREETVEAFLQRWLAAKERSKHAGTHTRYAGTVKMFLESLGAKATQNLRSVTTRDIETFYTREQARGKAVSSVNTDVKTLRTAFNRARREGIIDSSPADAFEFPEEERRKREAFTADQIARLLVAADPEWRVAIMFGYYVGARLGDAVVMTLGNLDFINGVVRYQQQKTEKFITCPMHEDLRRFLRGLKLTSQLPETPLTPALAVMDVGGRSGLSRAFKLIMEKAGVDDGRIEKSAEGGRSFSKLSFHALRASFVSTLADQGVEKDIRKTLAGHSNDVDHELYTKRQMATYQDAVGKLTSVWRN